MNMVILSWKILKKKSKNQKRESGFFPDSLFFVLFFMPENIIIFLKSKIENRKQEMVGGGEYWWETDLTPRPPLVRSSQFPAVIQLHRRSYGDGIGHGIYIILLRYQP